MININTVMLDMDGILADFHAGIYKAFGVPLIDLTIPQLVPWLFWEEWDGPPDLTCNDIEAKCDSDFWDTLPWMHDGKELLSLVLDKFDERQIYLLTTPMGHVESTTGKLRWIKRELPALYDRTIVISKNASKGLLAKPGRLLIDDRDKNVDEFKEAGGAIIEPPRPWNRWWSMSGRTIDSVKYELGFYQNAKRSTKKV